VIQVFFLLTGIREPAAYVLFILAVAAILNKLIGEKVEKVRTQVRVARDR
jgi:hypothetical protein